MFFKIAITTKEKNEAAIYWENQRKKAIKIRDEYDTSIENKYHKTFYKNYMVLNTRPPFMEPLPRFIKINNNN